MTALTPKGDVWCFESAEEEDYSTFLGEYIQETEESKDPEAIYLICSFWNNENDWETIVERAAVEGSTWYVWWMDGVRAYMRYEGCGKVGD